MNKTIDELHEIPILQAPVKPTAWAVKARRSPLMTLAVYCCYFVMLLM
jgi:hypothetical protein